MVKHARLSSVSQILVIYFTSICSHDLLFLSVSYAHLPFTYAAFSSLFLCFTSLHLSFLTILFTIYGCFLVSKLKFLNRYA